LRKAVNMAKKAIVKPLAHIYFRILGLWLGFALFFAYITLDPRSDINRVVIYTHLTMASILTAYPMIFAEHRKEYLLTVVSTAILGFIIAMILFIAALAHAVFWHL